MFDQLPSMSFLVPVAFVAGIVAYGLTQVVKSCFKPLGVDPWWWNLLMRGMPLLLGCGVGLLFSFSRKADSANVLVAAWPWVMSAGFTGGLFNVLLFKKIRGMLDNIKAMPGS